MCLRRALGLHRWRRAGAGKFLHTQPVRYGSVLPPGWNLPYAHAELLFRRAHGSKLGLHPKSVSAAAGVLLYRWQLPAATASNVYTRRRHFIAARHQLRAKPMPATRSLLHPDQRGVLHDRPVGLRRTAAGGGVHMRSEPLSAAARLLSAQRNVRELGRVGLQWSGWATARTPKPAVLRARLCPAARVLLPGWELLGAIRVGVYSKRRCAVRDSGFLVYAESMPTAVMRHGRR